MVKKYRPDFLGAVKLFDLFFAGKNDIADDIHLFSWEICIKRQG
jgi:hypothetical protein